MKNKHLLLKKIFPLTIILVLLISSNIFVCAYSFLNFGSEADEDNEVYKYLEVIIDKMYEGNLNSFYDEISIVNYNLEKNEIDKWRTAIRSYEYSSFYKFDGLLSWDVLITPVYSNNLNDEKEMEKWKAEKERTGESEVGELSRVTGYHIDALSSEVGKGHILHYHSYVGALTSTADFIKIPENPHISSLQLIEKLYEEALQEVTKNLGKTPPGVYPIDKLKSDYHNNNPITDKENTEVIENTNEETKVLNKGGKDTPNEDKVKADKSGFGDVGKIPGPSNPIEAAVGVVLPGLISVIAGSWKKNGV